MAHAALVGWHIGLQLVFPGPEQLEAPAVPDHGVEGREEAQPVVDLVPDRPGVLALRPEPQQAVDLGMSIARFCVRLEVAHLGGDERESSVTKANEYRQKRIKLEVSQR